MHTDPNLLVGLHTADDAAVYRLDGQRAIVQTLDFFPPVVDEPYDFGRVAAANALSDVYSMGGDVLLALNIVAFPETLDPSILVDILRGGADIVQQIGAVVAGGHTVTDREPKYGLAVTGIVRPDAIIRKGGAVPGERLILTKPIGTGVITTALRADAAEAADVAGAVESMTLINVVASRAARAASARSGTDITGFGLFGHASEMARASKAAFHISLTRVPLLPGALDYAREDYFPGGMERNRNYFSRVTSIAADVDPLLVALAFDPETSGGLLVAVHPDNVGEFARVMTAANQRWWDIGEVRSGQGLVVAS